MKVIQAGDHIWFWCPGCQINHQIAIAGIPEPWTWNNDSEKPTFSPSVKITLPTAVETTCHLFVEDGKIRYLDDCHHNLKGQTVEMEDMDT